MPKDLSKMLDTTDVTDIQERFASIEEILSTYTTSPTGPNAVSFQDIAQVVKPLPSSIDITDSNNIVQSVLNDEPLKNMMEDILGYVPSYIDDIQKAIENVVNELKDIIQKNILDGDNIINDISSKINDIIHITQESIISF